MSKSTVRSAPPAGAVFRREPLHEVFHELIATARGDLPATLVIRGGRLVNVCTGEIQDGINVAVRGSRIAYVGPNEPYATDENTEIVEAGGRFVAPGLIDGHCHIESTQLTVGQFARAVLPMGTTAGFFDAHEITNVLGLKGLRLMLEEARTTPMAAYMQVASCVPASSLDLETPGAVIGAEEVAEALSWGPDVIALGEVMNFPGVVYGDPRMIEEIRAALKAGRIVDGHYTWSPDDRLSAYAAAGITGDHELVTPEDALARLRLGMYAMIRRGSAWHDVAQTVRAHTEWGVDPRRIVLVTDDRSAESLIEEGHMNFVVRHAIQQGVRPVTAFQMATLNAAERFGVQRDIGSVTPGSYADIILLDGNLADVNVAMTIAAGKVVAKDGRMVVEFPPFAYPPEATGTVRLARPLAPQDFEIRIPRADGEVKVRAIRVIENHAETKEEIITLPVVGGKLVVGGALRAPGQDTAGQGSGVSGSDGQGSSEPGASRPDVAKLAVVERHGKSGAISLGIVTGLGFNKPVAVATTVAHDSHNLMIVGNSDELMARAGNELAARGGGIAVLIGCEGGTEGEGVKSVLMPLPIAGLMSPEPYERVAEQSRAVGRALVEAGCTLNYAFMTISLLALVVIPELRLSDKGLVKVGAGGFSLVDLVV